MEKCIFKDIYYCDANICCMCVSLSVTVFVMLHPLYMSKKVVIP